MGEIKSTLDIVMERTQHLKLSDDEKKQQEQSKIKQEVNGWVQKYLDQKIEIDELEETFNDLQTAHGKNAKGFILTGILSQLSIDSDYNKIIHVLNNILKINTENLTSSIIEFQEAVKIKSQERQNELLSYLTEDHGISGSAVTPNLDGDTTWTAASQDIRNKFEETLSQEKNLLQN